MNRNLSVDIVCRFVAFWANWDNFIENQLQVSNHVVVDWSNYLREICTLDITSKSSKSKAKTSKRKLAEFMFKRKYPEHKRSIRKIFKPINEMHDDETEIEWLSNTYHELGTDSKIDGCYLLCILQFFGYLANINK